MVDGEAGSGLDVKAAFAAQPSLPSIGAEGNVQQFPLHSISLLESKTRDRQRPLRDRGGDPVGGVHSS